MASIESRTYNGRKQYRARWRDADGRSRCSRWFDRTYDAERHRATVEADLHRGTYIDQNNRVTVAEYARQWAAARPHRKRTAAGYESIIRIHLDGTRLGARPMVKVRPSDIQAWATDRAQVLGAYTVQNLTGRLRSIFASAVLDGVIARNPVLSKRQLQMPTYQRRKLVPLTVEQVQVLAEAMPAHYRAMVIAQAGLGLRLSELLALRVEDVNFLRRTVRIEYQLEPGTLERVPPKTPTSRRDVPLPQVVAAALAEHMRAFPPADDGTIFTKAPGGRERTAVAHRGRIRHASYNYRFARAVEDAGLPSETSSHDLRHHFASVLLHAGESVHAVAERLGHVDAQLVLKVYGHIMPNSEDRTRRAIDAAWAEAGGQAGEAQAAR